VVQPATPPTSAATPKLKFDLALGLLLGLILGVAAAAVLELLDRRLRDEDDVLAVAPFSLLGTIPGSKRAGKPRPLEPELERVEAYRSLATSLRFLKVGDQVKTLMITSPGPRVGKTSVTLSLAVALAEFGQKVIAVECDLRNPRFSEYLELPATSGLSSALGGWTTCAQELIELEVPGASSNAAARLSVLPGGPAPPNPHALLTGTEIAEALHEFRSAADVVLIDTPPLGPLTDAVPLIPRVDGVALVVGLRRTTRDELRRARNLLEEFQAPVLGTILTTGQSSFVGLTQAWRKTDSPSSRAHATVARPA
jgi:capsular exopolysaccharide synthesis family protein